VNQSIRQNEFKTEEVEKAEKINNQSKEGTDCTDFAGLLDVENYPVP
jgi:hypothetical protein